MEVSTVFGQQLEERTVVGPIESWSMRGVFCIVFSGISYWSAGNPMWSTMQQFHLKTPMVLGVGAIVCLLQAIRFAYHRSQLQRHLKKPLKNITEGDVREALRLTRIEMIEERMKMEKFDQLGDLIGGGLSHDKAAKAKHARHVIEVAARAYKLI